MQTHDPELAFIAALGKLPEELKEYIVYQDPLNCYLLTPCVLHQHITVNSNNRFVIDIIAPDKDLKLPIIPNPIVYQSKDFIPELKVPCGFSAMYPILMSDIANMTAANKSAGFNKSYNKKLRDFKERQLISKAMQPSLFK